MGCGCKNENEVSYTEIDASGTVKTENKQKFNFKEKLNSFKNFNLTNKLEYIFFRKKNFSLIGLIIFFLIVPIMLLILNPFIVIILFNKLVFGKDIDIIDFMVFKKNKKRKK